MICARSVLPPFSSSPEHYPFSLLPPAPDTLAGIDILTDSPTPSIYLLANKDKAIDSPPSHL
jgi:hypothetical protein